MMYLYWQLSSLVCFDGSVSSNGLTELCLTRLCCITVTILLRRFCFLSRCWYSVVLKWLKKYSFRLILILTWISFDLLLILSGSALYPHLVSSWYSPDPNPDHHPVSWSSFDLLLIFYWNLFGFMLILICSLSWSS